jgi:large subunit ribosomal protein L15
VRANELPPVPGSTKKKKRIGRGNASGRGTYATRGIKGQQSRSGPDLRIGFEGGQNPLIRGLSRKRGFTNRFRVEYEAVNVSALAKLPAGSTVTPATLREAGIVKSASKPVKVLGDGDLEVKLDVEVEKISAGARQKIEAAGGKATALTAGRDNGAASQRGEAAAATPVPAGEAPVEPAAESPGQLIAEEPLDRAQDRPTEESAEAKPVRRTRAPRTRAKTEESEAES